MDKLRVVGISERKMGIMIDKKNVKKALKCCSKLKDCTNCPYLTELSCQDQLLADAFYVIHNLQDEKANLNNLCISKDEIIKRQQAEIERLNGNLFTISNACMQRVNEAIKEFAERLKEKQRTFIGDEYAYEYIPSIEIDVLLAEKAGEQDEKENICI